MRVKYEGTLKVSFEYEVSEDAMQMVQYNYNHKMETVGVVYPVEEILEESRKVFIDGLQELVADEVIEPNTHNLEIDVEGSVIQLS